MPYISPFMPHAEAIGWISKQLKSSRSEATRQIQVALADRAITGLCWDDQRPGMYAVMDSRPDFPPTDREFWKSEASIPDENGRIFDPQTKRRRTLLIPREIIYRFWPESGPRTKAKVGPHSAWNEFEQTYHRLVQQDRSMKTKGPTEVAKLIAQEHGKKIGERGWALRTLQQHIQRIRAKH